MRSRFFNNPNFVSKAIPFATAGIIGALAYSAKYVKDREAERKKEYEETMRNAGYDTIVVGYKKIPILQYCIAGMGPIYEWENRAHLMWQKKKSSGEEASVVAYDRSYKNRPEM